MQISYEKLFEKLKDKNMSQEQFKKQAKVSSGTITSLVNNKSITIETLCKICDFLNCMPNDIIEFIPEENYKKTKKIELNRQIIELQSQIDALQRQLSELEP